MDFTKLKTEDILEIKGKRYQVTEDWDKGFDKLLSGKERWYYMFEMVEIESGKITSTNKIYYYLDNKEIVFHDEIKDTKVKLKKEEVKLSSS